MNSSGADMPGKARWGVAKRGARWYLAVVEKMDNIKKNKLRVGIPRALLYHKYGKLWEVFLRELGAAVVLSPETNKEIIARGARLSIDESCLSVKIFVGHVDWLKDKVDVILTPHVACLKSGEEMCVKFMALVDTVRNIFPGVKILEYSVDAKNFETEAGGMILLGARLSRNPIKSILAYLKAKSAQETSAREKKEAQAREFEDARRDGKPLILIVAHSYTLDDNFLGKPIIDYLKKSGICVLRSDRINAGKARKMSKKISQTLYWTYHKELLGAAEYYKDAVEGMIFLTTFPCGPDALAINLCQSKMKGIPSIIISLDELESRVGLQTRLESFVDVINLKKCRKNK